MSGKYLFQRKHCVKRRKRKSTEIPTRRNDVYEKYFCVCDIALHLLPKFVVLPKSKKTRMARLATYSSALQSELKLYSPVIENGKMLEMNKNVSNGLNMWPLDEVVTQSALINPDYVGWLTDQSTGQSRWVVVADMLLCLFASNESEQPLSVLVLPGHEIKSMVFKSAKRDSIQESQRGQPLTRTISGMLRHQFMIRNPSTNKEHVFALEDKAERDQWVAMLRIAANLDTDIFTSESDDDTDESLNNSDVCNGNAGHPGTDDEVLSKNALNASSNTTPKTTQGLCTQPKKASSSETSTPLTNSNSSNSRSKSQARLSRSLSIHVVNSDTNSDQSPIQKYIPSSRSIAEPRITKHQSSLNLPDSLEKGPMFVRRYSMLDLTETIEEPESEERVTATSLKPPKSSKRLSTWFNKDAPVRSLNSNKQTSATRSTHQRKKFTNKLARKMSSIRVKLKNGRVQEGVDMPRLGSVQDFMMSGYLKVKCEKKWSTMWCVIAQGNMYCYKSLSVYERPEVMLPLHQCSVQAVRNITNSDWCVFKISHLNAYNTFFCTEDTLDYAQWIMVLKTESKVCDNIASPPSDTPNILSDEDSGSSTMSLHSDSRSETSLSDDLVKSRFHVSHNISASSRDVSLVMPNAQDVKMRESKRARSESDTSTSDGELKTSHLVTPQRNETRPPRSSSNPLFATLYEHKKQIAAISELKLCRKGSDDSVFSEQSHGSVGSNEQLNGQANSPRFSKTLTRSCILNIARGGNNATSKIQRMKMKRNSADSRTRSHTEPSSPFPPSPFSSNTLDGSLLSQSSWNEHFSRGAFNTSYSSFDSFHDNRESHTDSESDQSSAETNRANVNKLLATMPGFRQSLTCKYTAPSTYDQNLRQVWKSGQYSPVGMLSATMPDRPAIFSRHLPGPNNEGVLLVSDSTGTLTPAEGTTSIRPHGGSFKVTNREKNLANRKKSLSDGNLCESLRQYQASIRRKKVRDSIAARDLETPSIVGYLDRKENGGTWESCWCVLKDSSLYRYSSAVDEMTDDILLLHGFEVLRCPEVSGKEFAFELLHPDYPSELLAAANSEELSEWITKLKQATQHMSIEGLNLEQGSSKQFTDIDAKKTDENRVKHCSKQQLLQEVLQEKMRLEQSQRRKRKERSKLCNVFQNDDSPLGSAVSTPELSPDVVSLTSYNSCNSVRVSAESQSQGSLMEQSLREISHLRQRKASTQLKVETLQRQLTMSAATKQKPRRFKIVLGNKNQNAGKDKESSELAPVDTTLVQKQLQTLQGELEKISSNLEAKKKIALGDLRAITETKPSGHKKKGSSNSNSNDDQQSIQSVRSSNGNVSSSNSSLNLNSKDSKRNSCGMSTSGVQNGNEERTQNSQRTKNELTRTASVDPPVVRHSWDTNKARTNDRSSATCQPIARDRAHTTPDDLTTRARHGSSSCQSEIDPAVLAQISAFEELLQERLHLQ